MSPQVPCASTQGQNRVLPNSVIIERDVHSWLMVFQAEAVGGWIAGSWEMHIRGASCCACPSHTKRSKAQGRQCSLQRQVSPSSEFEAAKSQRA
eukprot:2226256-Amphidinium_carterae.1